MSSKERISMLLGHLKMNANEFASSLGYKRTDRIYNVLNGRNGISAAMARDIHQKYEYVNFDWIAYGKGEMLSAESNENEKLRVSLPDQENTAETGGKQPQTGDNVTALADSFEELMNKYQDMMQQRDYWRTKAQDLEYKLAKLEAV